MFEQAELQGTQMGPNGPPNAKGTALIAPEIANYRKSGHLDHFGHFAPNGHFGHFGKSFPNQGGHAEKKPLGVLLASTRPRYILIWYKLYPPEARQKFPLAEVSPPPRFALATTPSAPRHGGNATFF